MGPRQWVVAPLVAMALAGCLSTRLVLNSPGTAQTDLVVKQSVGRVTPSILIVADNQQHNLFGGYLETMSWVTRKWIATVAVRAPEVNLWSHWVLEGFISDASTGPSPARMVFHLGDASDIACSSELDAFLKSMARATSGKVPWLFAPGNHDSYLAGNFNDHAPTSQCAEEEGFAHAFVDPARSWSGGCATLDARGVPQTKDRLIRRLEDALHESQRVEWKPEMGLPASENDGASSCKVLRGSPAKGSLLATIKYDAVIRLCAEGRHTLGSYASFIVQRVELSDGVVGLIIDTTDIGSSRLSLWQAVFGAIGLSSHGDAKQRGAVSAGQQGAITLLLKNQPSTRIAFGHSPWAELTGASRNFLSQQHIRSYVSAHTHMRSAVLLHGSTGGASRFFELNVGSTTDWPIQAIRLGVVKVAGSTQMTWKSLGAGDGDDKPPWIATCLSAETIRKWRHPDYRAFIDAEGYRSYVDYDLAKPSFAPLLKAVDAARAMIVDGQTGDAADPRAAIGIPYPRMDEAPSERWKTSVSLNQKIELLERRMEIDANARQYAICQAIWAAEAVKDDAGLVESIGDYEPPSAFANESVGVSVGDR